MSPIRLSAAAIHGSDSGSRAASAASRCRLVAPYSSPVATRIRSAPGSSPNALPSGPGARPPGAQA